MSNKTDEDDESVALHKIPSFNAHDATLIEGFSLITAGLIRRAHALKCREDGFEAARQKRTTQLAGNEEMEHWEDSLMLGMREPDIGDEIVF